MQTTTIDDELRTLAEKAVVYAFPLYEMSRMRAATSPQRTDSAGEAPKPHAGATCSPTRASCWERARAAW